MSIRNVFPRYSFLPFITVLISGIVLWYEYTAVHTHQQINQTATSTHQHAHKHTTIHRATDTNANTNIACTNVDTNVRRTPRPPRSAPAPASPSSPRAAVPSPPPPTPSHPHIESTPTSQFESRANSPHVNNQQSISSEQWTSRSSYPCLNEPIDAFGIPPNSKPTNFPVSSDEIVMGIQTFYQRHAHVLSLLKTSLRHTPHIFVNSDREIDAFLEPELLSYVEAEQHLVHPYPYRTIESPYPQSPATAGNLTHHYTYPFPGIHWFANNRREEFNEKNWFFSLKDLSTDKNWQNVILGDDRARNLLRIIRNAYVTKKDWKWIAMTDDNTMINWSRLLPKLARFDWRHPHVLAVPLNEVYSPGDMNPLPVSVGCDRNLSQPVEEVCSYKFEQAAEFVRTHNGAPPGVDVNALLFDAPVPEHYRSEAISPRPLNADATSWPQVPARTAEQKKRFPWLREHVLWRTAPLNFYMGGGLLLSRGAIESLPRGGMEACQEIFVGWKASEARLASCLYNFGLLITTIGPWQSRGEHAQPGWTDKESDVYKSFIEDRTHHVVHYEDASLYSFIQQQYLDPEASEFRGIEQSWETDTFIDDQSTRLRTRPRE